MVQMKHPNLPTHQTFDAPEMSVKHWERSGWRRVKSAEKPVEKPPEKSVETKPVGKADAKPSNENEGAL